VEFYKRNPRRALTGMAELTLRQRGAYNSLIDVLYDRDGVLPDDDRMVAHLMSVDLRAWRNVKAELMACGKIRVHDGFILANGVTETILSAQLRSRSALANAQLRWDRSKKAKEFNGARRKSQCDGNAIQSIDIKEERVGELSEEEIASLQRLTASLRP